MKYYDPVCITNFTYGPGVVQILHNHILLVESVFSLFPLLKLLCCSPRVCTHAWLWCSPERTLLSHSLMHMC